MRKRSIIYGLSLLIAVLLLASFQGPFSKNYFEIVRSIETFASLYKEVNSYYVDDVNPNKLMETGLKAMLSALDPYTNFIPEELIETYRTQNTGQYAGIGATTRIINGRVVVVMLIEGFPAKENGLMIGDEIVQVNGIDITGLAPQETDKLMKGQINSAIMLGIKRYGHEDPIFLSFKREKVKIKNVPYFGLTNETTGYINLTEFTVNAGREVRHATEELIAKGAEKIILDLRDNPGGLLIEAVNIVNIFVEKGREVVTTRGRDPRSNATYMTLNNPVNTEIPVVVLINNRSASASEIVAGALQDYDRAVILGSRSFGKGLVQVTRPLSYNSQLKVTTAKYYIPSGRCIQALDYSNRNEDGSVGTVPDSLKRRFKTSNGRPVFDGGGIQPDIVVSDPQDPEIVTSLIQNGIILDYATEYFYKNKQTPEPTDFSLSENEYGTFVNWSKNKPFGYTLGSEKKLTELKMTAQQEKYFHMVAENIQKIDDRISEQKKDDLSRYKDEIKSELEKEIIGRTHYDKGRIEFAIGSDNLVNAAEEVLHNTDKYRSILGTEL